MNNNNKLLEKLKEYEAHFKPTADDGEKMLQIKEVLVISNFELISSHSPRDNLFFFDFGSRKITKLSFPERLIIIYFF